MDRLTGGCLCGNAARSVFGRSADEVEMNLEGAGYPGPTEAELRALGHPSRVPVAAVSAHETI